LKTFLQLIYVDFVSFFNLNAISCGKPHEKLTKQTNHYESKIF